MWQKCPVCNGSGATHSPLSTSSSTLCSVCEGKKIISELNGLPPGGNPSIGKDELIFVQVNPKLDEIESTELFEKLMTREFNFFESAEDYQLIEELENRNYVCFKQFGNIDIITSNSLQKIFEVLSSGDFAKIKKLDEFLTN